MPSPPKPRETGPDDSWDAIVGRLIAPSWHDPAAQASLAQLCLAGDELMPERSIEPRAGGLPQGRPPAPVVRRAAHALVESTRHRRDRVGLYLSTVGLVFAHWKATSGARVIDVSGQPMTALEARTLAVDQARVLRDDALVAWTLYHRGICERSLARWTECVGTLQLAADLAEEALHDGVGHPGPFGAAPAAWADPLDVQLRVIACRAVKWISLTAPLLGDIGLMQSTVDRLMALSEPLREARPSVAVEALTRQAALARHFGDRDTLRQAERTLEHWARSSGNNRVLRGWLAAAAANATHLRDFGRAAELRGRQLDAAVADCSRPPAPRSPSTAYLAAVAELHESGMKARLVSVGNSAYEIAFMLWFRGQTKASDVARDEALGWLDLAEAAWQPDGGNGAVAARLTRARLLVDSSTLDRSRAADEALELGGQAMRAGLRTSAVDSAAQWSAPGDPRVEARINELLATATRPERARLLFARAVWQERLARHLEESGGATGHTSTAWRRAGADATDAGELLEIEGAFLDAERAARAWGIAAAAVTRTDPTSRGRACQLDYLVRATRCVAELQITASESRRRSEVTALYGHLFRSALELAVQLKDVHAADVVLEAIRRDRVGVMITDLAHRNDVGEAIAAAAERVISANSALSAADRVLTDSEMPDESTAESDDSDRAFVDRTSALVARNTASLEKANDILGVVSVLADGRSLPSVDAADVLAARAPTNTPTAILQLYALGTGLVRRLTWVEDGGGFHEYVDQVEGTQPLPGPLKQLLDRSSRERPTRLMIVPTGMFDVAFDALTLHDGSRLVGRATVSVHASLITMLYAAKHARPATVSTALAMYDLADLVHTKAELAALRDNVEVVEEIQSRADLVTALAADRGSRLDVFALAVHGADDANGWGQTKRLPDGTLFSAAEALALSYPPLCVLASCHSNVRIGADLEMAGFPMALFARGAFTVIGSLYAIDDRATSEIMQRYWYHLGRGIDPVMALRLAKLDWLDAPETHGSTDGRDVPAIEGSEPLCLWSGLVAIGGAHL